MQAIFSALTSLRDASIPQLLVIGGLLLIVLPVIEPFTEKVDINPAQKRSAITLGVVFLLIGIFLYILPVLIVPGGTTSSGTVITNPTAAPLITPTSDAALLYAEDFEDGVADEWVVVDTGWEVVDDGTGNQVFRGQGGSDWVGTHVGAEDWTDYRIEFRLKTVEPGTEQTQTNLLVRTVFDVSEYGLDISTDENGAALVVGIPTPGPDGVEWGYETIADPDGNMQLQNGNWYPVVVEVDGDSIRATVNGVPLTATDSRYDRGLVYLNVGPAATVYFDDFRIRAL